MVLNVVLDHQNEAEKPRYETYLNFINGTKTQLMDYITYTNKVGVQMIVYLYLIIPSYSYGQIWV